HAGAVLAPRQPGPSAAAGRQGGCVGPAGGPEAAGALEGGYRPGCGARPGVAGRLPRGRTPRLAEALGRRRASGEEGQPEGVMWSRSELGCEGRPLITFPLGSPEPVFPSMWTRD